MLLKKLCLFHSAEDEALAGQFTNLKDSIGGLLEQLDRIRNNINQSEELAQDGTQCKYW